MVRTNDENVVLMEDENHAAQMASQEYQKKSLLEQILIRPDTYVGPVQLREEEHWVMSADGAVMQRIITFVPGLYKICDELFVNAADNYQNDKSTNQLLVAVHDANSDHPSITVENNGKCIPIYIHTEEGMWIPQLTLGELLTSSNYDDKKKRTTGGRNGFGAKLANIFSRKFVVEIQDGERGIHYKQTWTDNMTVCGQPEITNQKGKAKGKTFTRITFWPDLPRFGLTQLDDDHMDLLRFRVASLAGTIGSVSGDKVRVYFNSVLFPYHKFASFAELFLLQDKDSHLEPEDNDDKSTTSTTTTPAPMTPASLSIPSTPNASTSLTPAQFPNLVLPEGEAEEKEHPEAKAAPKVVPIVHLPMTNFAIPALPASTRRPRKRKPFYVYEQTEDKQWEIICGLSYSGSFQHMSFVNNIYTSRGGKHVTAVVDQIVDHVQHLWSSKNKKQSAPQPKFIKSHLFLFINCLIPTPAFTSQTKEELDTPKSKFGSPCEVSNKIAQKLFQNGLYPRLTCDREVQDKKKLKQNDGKKQRTVRIPKLEDANHAGTRNSDDCILILTEGDSAKASAMSGLSVVGRDKWGVFPLRGKMLNVQDVSTERYLDNKEIAAITKAMGLKEGHVYSDTNELRYRGLMLMTDQDNDGSHIKGLLINWIETKWPSLLHITGFLSEFITPIIKARRGSQCLSFFTQQEAIEWLNANNQGRGWEVKYYKGLGTSTAEEMQEMFKNIDQHRKFFVHTGDECKQALRLAFNKRMADARKNFVRNCPANIYLDQTNTQEISYSDFVHKEFVLFSVASTVRSIPSMVDGLKPSQRKVLFACFKRNLIKEIKVAQLGGSVAEQTAYHHGEKSLEKNIVGLAQSFVGANNAPYLVPQGQFGTRLLGGKDAAASRYIFTYLQPITRSIFKSDDEPLLKFLLDDNQSIEPEWFIPILPTVLINGVRGIGTGFSTFVPNYNPKDVRDKTLAILQNWDPVHGFRSDFVFPEIHPWYFGFTGTITPRGAKSYTVDGEAKYVTPNTIRITELPIGVWTQEYQEFLEKLREAQVIQDYQSSFTDTKICFTITLSPAQQATFATYNDEQLLSRLKLRKLIHISNMVLYNAQGLIHVYSTIDDIFRDFIPLRYHFYLRRKEYCLRQLETQIRVSRNKERFILAVNSNQVLVQNVPKQRVNQQLKEQTFDADDQGSFKYLLNMNISAMTQEEVDQLRKTRESQEAEYKALDQMDPKDMWIQDLNEFETKWQEYQADMQQKTTLTSASNKGRGRKRKAAGESRGETKRRRGK